MEQKKTSLPDQGIRTLRSRRGDGTVPAVSVSSSNDGLEGGLPAGAPSNRATAEVEGREAPANRGEEECNAGSSSSHPTSKGTKRCCVVIKEVVMRPPDGVPLVFRKAPPAGSPSTTTSEKRRSTATGPRPASRPGPSEEKGSNGGDLGAVMLIEDSDSDGEPIESDRASTRSAPETWGPRAIALVENTRKRGRPPTTGDWVGITGARKEKHRLDLEEVDIGVTRMASHYLSKAHAILGEDEMLMSSTPTIEVLEAGRSSLEAVAGLNKLAKGLKGTTKKVIKTAVAQTTVVLEELAARLGRLESRGGGANEAEGARAPPPPPPSLHPSPHKEAAERERESERRKRRRSSRRYRPSWTASRPN